MSLGRRKTSCQPEFWIASSEVVQGPGHPFYSKLTEVLSNHGFDEFVEERCAPFYHESRGRPSIPPGVYFRMLLIGYFEGIDSERGIAWRCADSLGLRAFLGYALTERTPDHSSLSVIRRRIDLETHREVFVWVLKVLKQSGLLKGKTLGIDATTLEANAAMRKMWGVGKPRSLQDGIRALLGFIFAVFRAVRPRIGPFGSDSVHPPVLSIAEISSPAPNHGATISFRLSKKWVFQRAASGRTGV